jgi:hypothetical protein
MTSLELQRIRTSGGQVRQHIGGDGKAGGTERRNANESYARIGGQVPLPGPAAQSPARCRRPSMRPSKAASGNYIGLKPVGPVQRRRNGKRDRERPDIHSSKTLHCIRTGVEKKASSGESVGNWKRFEQLRFAERWVYREIVAGAFAPF